MKRTNLKKKLDNRMKLQKKKKKAEGKISQK